MERRSLQDALIGPGAEGAAHPPTFSEPNQIIGIDMGTRGLSITVIGADHKKLVTSRWDIFVTDDGEFLHFNPKKLIYVVRERVVYFMRTKWNDMLALTKFLYYEHTNVPKNMQNEGVMQAQAAFLTLVNAYHPHIKIRALDPIDIKAFYNIGKNPLYGMGKTAAIFRLGDYISEADWKKLCMKFRRKRQYAELPEVNENTVYADPFDSALIALMGLADQARIELEYKNTEKDQLKKSTKLENPQCMFTVVDIQKIPVPGDMKQHPLDPTGETRKHIREKKRKAIAIAAPVTKSAKPTKQPIAKRPVAAAIKRPKKIQRISHESAPGGLGGVGDGGKEGEDDEDTGMVIVLD
jgi:hypothetical protein